MTNDELASWQPGKPVKTASDFTQWRARKKQRVLYSQRFRRAHYRRIDYYPSGEAMAVIARHLNGQRTFAEIIDALVLGSVPE